MAVELNRRGVLSYEPGWDCSYIEGHAGRLRRLAALRAEVPRLLAARGVPTRAESRIVLVVGQGLRVAVMLARCQMIGAQPKWVVQPHIRPHPDWLLLERQTRDNTAVEDYWLVAEGSQYAQLGASHHRRRRERHRAADLEGVIELVAARSGVTPRSREPAAGASADAELPSGGLTAGSPS